MFIDRLALGARAMGVALTGEQLRQIESYHRLLVEAGRTMNLTRVSEDEGEAIDRNYLDSLAPLAQGLTAGVRTLADAGTGAGLPGVPLSIALPHVQVTLIDALAKRVAFLQDVIGALGLKNAVAVHARCEDAGRDRAFRDAFDMVTARAVADTPLMLELALPLVKPGGRLVLYKGPAVDAELARSGAALSALGGRVQAVLPAPVPGRDWDHRLLVVDKVGATPGSYPRKAGVPERRPLG